MKVTIDFSSIRSYDDFYGQLKEKIYLRPYFGNNLDALFDSLSGDVALPLHITFINMNGFQKRAFVKLLETMEDLQEEVEGFSFDLI